MTPQPAFMCYKRKVLETIQLDKIKFVGYAFQIEMKYTTVKHGFKLVEVPIIFINRTARHLQNVVGYIWRSHFWCNPNEDQQHFQEIPGGMRRIWDVDFGFEISIPPVPNPKSQFRNPIFLGDVQFRIYFNFRFLFHLPFKSEIPIRNPIFLFRKFI
jgi:hypothetical protein